MPTDELDTDAFLPPEPTYTWTCECGAAMARYRGQGDQSCSECGGWYNASGQRLRDDWMYNPSMYDDEIGDLEGYEMQYAGDY